MKLLKILIILIFWILLLYLFLFSFPSFSRSIFSAETLFSYQWRTFIYFLPIKFYRKRALHLKVFLTQLGNVDIRFSFRENTISKYLRFSHQSFLFGKNNKRDSSRSFLQFLSRSNLLYYTYDYRFFQNWSNTEKNKEKFWKYEHCMLLIIILFHSYARSSIIQNLIT